MQIKTVSVEIIFFFFFVAVTIFLSPLKFSVTVTKQKLSSENCDYDKVILLRSCVIPLNLIKV